MDKVINKTMTIGTDSARLFEDNVPIKEMIITNTSAAAQVISVSFGQESIALQGIVLQPTFSYSSPAGSIIDSSSYAISSAAGGTIAIFARFV